MTQSLTIPQGSTICTLRAIKLVFIAMVSSQFVRAEGDSNSASVRPVIATPEISKAPEIDGKMSEGEWNTATVYRFICQNTQPKDLLNPRVGAPAQAQENTPPLLRMDYNGFRNPRYDSHSFFKGSGGGQLGPLAITPSVADWSVGSISDFSNGLSHS